MAWIVVAGIAMVGSLAAMFIPAMAGVAVESSTLGAVWIWSSLFFYLYMKRRGRAGWLGLLLGTGTAMLAYFVAVSLHSAVSVT